MIHKIHIDNVKDAQDILKSAGTEQLFKKSKSSKDKPWMISLQSIFNELSGWQDDDWKDPLMGDALVVKVSKAIETYNITKAQFNQIAERNPDYDLGDIWKEAVELREEKIKKAEENELNRVYDELGFEKAKHKDGDMHPNGKWVWVSSAAGGKGDWRVKGGRTHATHAAAQTPKAVSTHHQKWMDFVKKQKDGVVSGEIHKKWDKVDAAYGYGMTKINHYFQEAIKLSMQLNENNGQIGVFSKQIRDLKDSIRKEVYDSARTLEQNLQHRLTGVKPNTKRYNDMYNAVDDMVYQIKEHGNHCLDAIYKITEGQEFLDYLKEMQSAKNKRKQDALDGKAAVTRDMLTSEFEDAGFRITDRDTFSGKRVRITELANGNFEVKFQDAYSNGKVVNEISKKYGMTVTLDKNKSTFGYSVVILSKKKNQTTTTSPKSKDSIQTAADRLKLQQEYSTLNNLIKKPSSKKYADDIRKRMDEIRALGYQGDGKWKVSS